MIRLEEIVPGSRISGIAGGDFVEILAVSVIALFDGLACPLFDGSLVWRIMAPTRSSMPSCWRSSRTLRAAEAVARRRAILDGRCARRLGRRAGRDGRMVPIEPKDGDPADVTVSSVPSGSQ
jgi:hypothetical protein